VDYSAEEVVVFVYLWWIDPLLRVGGRVVVFRNWGGVDSVDVIEALSLRIFLQSRALKT
jgi:hypothetical protein